MLTHKQKLHLARMPGMRDKGEKRTSQRIAQPRGMMISRLFTSRAWIERAGSIRAKQLKAMGRDLTNVQPESKMDQGTDVTNTSEIIKN